MICNYVQCDCIAEEHPLQTSLKSLFVFTILAAAVVYLALDLTREVVGGTVAFANWTLGFVLGVAATLLFTVLSFSKAKRELGIMLVCLRAASPFFTQPGFTSLVMYGFSFVIAWMLSIQFFLQEHPVSLLHGPVTGLIAGVQSAGLYIVLSIPSLPIRKIYIGTNGVRRGLRVLHWKHVAIHQIDDKEIEMRLGKMRICIQDSNDLFRNLFATVTPSSSLFR